MLGHAADAIVRDIGKSRRMNRVLVYSHDTFGLGNIRRMLEISRHLVESDPGVSVLIITGSPMLHAFRIPARIDYVKLPCLARTVRGDYETKYLDLSLDETVRLRANVIRSAVLDFQPDLILVDKKPFGVKDELAGVLEGLSAHARRPKLVLLLRDILDSPEATTPVWRRNRYYEAISAYYDEVLVVGTPEIFDLGTEYAFPPLAASKITYCGYIARSRSRRSSGALRNELGVGRDERLVLATAGGGADGFELLRSYLEALFRLPEAVAPHSLVVCGPEMSEPQREHLAALACRLPKVSLQPFSDDMMSLIDAADLVVCMGGYNTVCEVLTLGKRAIVVPRVRPVQEQWIRAQRMAARGLLRALHPDSLSAQALGAALCEELAALEHSAWRRPALDMDGLESVAASIRAQLSATASHPAEIIALAQREASWQSLRTLSAS
jgi:predicted glycosyltransferase